MTRLMSGVPPSANGQVALANWRQAPFRHECGGARAVNQITHPQPVVVYN